VCAGVDRIPGETSNEVAAPRACTFIPPPSTGTTLECGGRGCAAASFHVIRSAAFQSSSGVKTFEKLCLEDHWPCTLYQRI